MPILNVQTAKFALTLSGAANIVGLVPEDSYAFGNREAAEKAWAPLARNMGLTVQEAAEKVLEFAAVKNGKVVQSFIQDYGLDLAQVTFVGGGGGAAAVVPHLAKKFKVPYKIAKNAEVISPIGVALAMVRDMVERSIQNPTEKDLLAIRREAIRKVVEAGAKIETVQVKIEVDPQQQKVRAIATGSTELRAKEMKSDPKTDEEILAIVAENLGVAKEELKIAADNGHMVAVCYESVRKKFLIFREKIRTIRLVDREGVIRLQRRNGKFASVNPRSGKAPFAVSWPTIPFPGMAGPRFPISILPSEAGSLIWAGCKTRNRFTPSVKPSLWGCKRMKTSSLCAPGRRRMNDRQAKPIDGEDLTMKAFPFPDKISSRQELARDLFTAKSPPPTGKNRGSGLGDRGKSRQGTDPVPARGRYL